MNREAALEDCTAALSTMLGEQSGSRAVLPRKGPSFLRSAHDPGHVLVRLDERAVCGNMQTDEAAFEAWLLGLKALDGFERATLCWTAPDPHKPARYSQHYQRFLFRVACFLKLFGDDWFSVETPHLLAACQATEAERILNLPGKRPFGTPSEPKLEARLEAALADGENTPGPLRQAFRLEWVNRQLPVGLFTQDPPSKPGRIFPGGASAIDLVGVDAAGDLWLFELKQAGNIGAGALSELMFYAWCMAALKREALPRFCLASGTPGKRWLGGRVALDQVAAKGRRIHAVFLLPEGCAHPLVSHPPILALLNAACARQVPELDFRLHPFRYTGGQGGAPFAFEFLTGPNP